MTKTLTASVLAEVIRSHQVTSSEILEMLLARIQTHNPALNAIITLDAEGARRRAHEADKALARGELWGPLHGVPITIKDSFETAGMRSVSGYPPFTNHIPTQDAPPVARLRQAGAIILGKTNVPTLARGNHTINPVFGRTNNPWDVTRNPGGSSGGPAAAIAAGLSYLELGSDIGGSVRHPAHFCGIYGLKLTGGRVSGQGHLHSPQPLRIPAGWEALLQLGAFGPMARSMNDLRLSAPLLAESASPVMETRLPKSSLRIAWTDDFGGTAIDTDTRRLMQQMAERLAQAGCFVQRLEPANLDFEDAWYTSGVCLGAIDTLFHPPLTRGLYRFGAPLLAALGPREPLMQGLFAGASLNATSVHHALCQRELMIEQLEQFLHQWDAWICPIFPTAAFTHRAEKAPIEVDGQPVPQLLANLKHAILFNVSGHPAVALPIGFSSEGLPVGIQIVGRRWAEMDLLNVAEQIDQIVNGYRTPPEYA